MNIFNTKYYRCDRINNIYINFILHYVSHINIYRFLVYLKIFLPQDFMQTNELNLYQEMLGAGQGGSLL